MGEILDPSASGSTGNINLESIEGAQIKRGCTNRINIWIRLYDAGGYFSLWFGTRWSSSFFNTTVQFAREAQECSSKYTQRSLNKPPFFPLSLFQIRVQSAWSNSPVSFQEVLVLLMFDCEMLRICITCCCVVDWLTLAYSESSVLLWKNATLCQWKAFRTEATDLEICVSGGRVRANVGKSSLLEVSSCVQNCSWFFIFSKSKKKKNEREKGEEKEQRR